MRLSVKEIKKFFSPNIGKQDRVMRGIASVALLAGAGFGFTVSAWLGLVLGVLGLFVMFEALRGWCVMRACAFAPHREQAIRRTETSATTIRGGNENIQGKPETEKRELSILFSDVAQFTTFSEEMTSEDMAKLMTGVFGGAAECIHKVEGTVVKFVGDAMFAIWNAPERKENHQELACRGALLLRDRTMNLTGDKGNQSLDVRTRIGLHSGLATVGNIGSSTRIDYTAVGQSVNLALHMERLNNHTGTDILVTEAVEKAVHGKFVTRHVGRFRFQASEASVEVFELLGESKDAEASRPWREKFAKGLELFKARKFAEAAEIFQEVARLHHNDGPANFYFEQTRGNSAHQLPADWDGTIEWPRQGDNDTR